MLSYGIQVVWFNSDIPDHGSVEYPARRIYRDRPGESATISQIETHIPQGKSEIVTKLCFLITPYGIRRGVAIVPN